MGVSRQAVSKWERDKAYPDLDRLVCICEILDVQVGELIYGKGEEPEAPEEVSRDGTSANNAVHLKNLRGKGRLARLKILFCVMMQNMLSVNWWNYIIRHLNFYRVYMIQLL